MNPPKKELCSLCIEEVVCDDEYGFNTLCKHPLHHDCARQLNDLRCPTCRRDMTDSFKLSDSLSDTSPTILKEVYESIVHNKKIADEEKISDEQEAIRRMLFLELFSGIDSVIQLNSILGFGVSIYEGEYEDEGDEGEYEDEIIDDDTIEDGDDTIEYNVTQDFSERDIINIEEYEN